MVAVSAAAHLGAGGKEDARKTRTDGAYICFAGPRWLMMLLLLSLDTAGGSAGRACCVVSRCSCHRAGTRSFGRQGWRSSGPQREWRIFWSVHCACEQCAGDTQSHLLLVDMATTLPGRWRTIPFLVCAQSVHVSPPLVMGANGRWPRRRGPRRYGRSQSRARSSCGGPRPAAACRGRCRDSASR